MEQIQITNDCSAALPFQRIAGENNTTKDHRDYFSHYYVPNASIKDFVLIDGKSFFDLPVKNEDEVKKEVKKEAYKKIMDMSNNKEYTADNLLDFAYF